MVEFLLSRAAPCSVNSRTLVLAACEACNCLLESVQPQRSYPKKSDLARLFFFFLNHHRLFFIDKTVRNVRLQRDLNLRGKVHSPGSPGTTQSGAFTPRQRRLIQAFYKHWISNVRNLHGTPSMYWLSHLCSGLQGKSYLIYDWTIAKNPRWVQRCIYSTKPRTMHGQTCIQQVRLES